MIAHVLGSFGVGGGERVALDLATGQLAAGHRSLAVSLADGPLRASFEANGVATLVTPKRPAGLDPSLLFRLGVSLGRHKPHIVHTHNPLPLIYATLPARVLGVPVIHTKHGLNPERRRAIWLRRRAAALVHSFVAVSATTGRQARERNECAPEKLRVIRNGISLAEFLPDPERRREVRSELGASPQTILLGTVGRCHPDKNQRLLLRAAAPLLSDTVRLVVVGDGPVLHELRREAVASGAAAHVQFLGSRMDVPRLLAGFDVFAISSRTEGLPLVVAEAMAASLPVVATAVGGLPEVVLDRETGYLVPPGDEQALRTALAALIGDTGLRHRFGSHGRKVALRDFSVERMLDEYMAAYEGALGRS